MLTAVTAAEWDEREQTPWPVIQEAARAGIYSLDFFASAWADESGISLPLTTPPWPSRSPAPAPT